MQNCHPKKKKKKPTDGWMRFIKWTNMGKGKVLHQMDQRNFLLYPKANVGTWDKLWW